MCSRRCVFTDYGVGFVENDGQRPAPQRPSSFTSAIVGSWWPMVAPAQRQQAAAQQRRSEAPHSRHAELAKGDHQLLKPRQGVDGEESVAANSEGFGRQL
mmetsp:Transcript_44480/g.61864  ORF Transcript_44480/g.61864 Transcript_44480/m.61864 type:complete len:100 (-) Transcript_44480:759-1058(-)